MDKRVQVSLYLNTKDIKKVKQYCLDRDVKYVNEFYEKAILEKLEREVKVKDSV